MSSGLPQHLQAPLHHGLTQIKHFNAVAKGLVSLCLYACYHRVCQLAAPVTCGSEEGGIQDLLSPSPARGDTPRGRRQLAVGCTVSDSGSYFPLPRSGSPYAQVPIFPLVSKQDATTLAKPKTGLQKVARQRNKPTASLRSHISHERNRVQEVRHK